MVNSVLVSFFVTLLLFPVVYIIVIILTRPLIKKQKTQLKNQVEIVQKREEGIELLKETFKDLEQEEEWNHIKDQI